MSAVERNAVLCIASLPLLFLLGVLPPIEALLYWLPEWINTHLFGGSPSPHVVRTYVMLFLSVGAVLLCLPPHHLWATLCACFCGFILSLDLAPAYQWLCAGPCLKKINWRVLLGYSGLLASSMSLAALPHLWHISLIDRWINSPFLVVLLIFSSALASIQAPYAVFGFFRNPFYPEVVEVDAFKTFRRRFGPLVGLGKLLLKMVSPLAMVTFLSKLATRTSNTYMIVSAMAHVTCFRVVWQRTEAALLDLCIFWTVHRWTTLLEASSLDPLPAVWLIEISRQWVTGFGARCHLAAVLFVTFMSQVKLRLRFLWLFPVVNLLFLPLLLVLVAISAFLQASLLPLFSLPLFLPTFPRPSKFWPGNVGQSASSCSDSVYYKQMAPHLTEAIRVSIANGTMGSLEAGALLLARLEERLLWIQVLESGYGFHTFNIKGLELQETSCHAVEAQKVDELFEAALLDSRMNQEPFHSLLPVDFVPVLTYSSVKGVLTGVIDSHEFSDVLGNFFNRALVWLLLQFKLADLTENGLPQRAESPTEKSDDARSVGESRIPETWADAVRSLTSIGSADWSDSDDPLEQGPRGEPEGRSTNTAETGERIRDIELQVPVQNVWSSSAPVVRVARWVDEKPILTAPSVAPCDSTLGLPEMWLGVADDNDIETLAARNVVAREFSEVWFWKVLERQLENAPRTVQALCENSRTDHKLLQQYRDIVTFCHVATMSPDDMPNPETICSAFSGRLRSSGSTEHPINNASLQDIATCAFRYSVKLALDAVLIGSADNDAQLMEALEDLDSDWFIGMEGSSSWSEAVLKETPQLFCIFHDREEDVYRSHLLTLREVSVPVGRLHTETVRGLWSTLSLELLYLTNDDDERYSIQAQPTILRNLTIQAANPPLGYPIFSSSAITVATLW
ncbi:pecanex-like protein 4 isoform X2 [Ornithodoros turicata]